MVSAPIRIAIVGGGLCGAALMNALSRHRHLDVHLYEAKSTIAERGASVGLASNAHRALDLLGLGDVAQKAQAVKMGASYFVMGEGPDAQETVVKMGAGIELVHRAALLRELITPLQKDSIHYGKRVSSISGSTIYFEDGTSAEADLIIGADGIHSRVRRYALGEGPSHPATEPVFAGFWDCRTIVPLRDAQERLGKHRIDKDDPHQHFYIGDKSMAMHDIISGGEHVCVVVGGTTPPDWDSTRWNHPVSRQWLDSVFQNWGELGANLLDLLCSGQEETPTFMQWASAEAPRLHNGANICLVGDAAHATTPWQGSGLALALEDSLILQGVLGKCDNVKDIPAALEAYDQLMRPRGQRIIESSHQTGLVCTGADGLDAKSIRGNFAQRWGFIMQWDTKGELAGAIENFERLRSRQR